MLSFVIPVYKPNLPLFRKVIKALLAQSLKEIELIFVLDGADSLAEAVILEEMNGSKVEHKVIIQDHAGAQRARNRGAQEAKGDFWVFWDCDCIIEPHAAKAWVDCFAKYPDIAFVYSGYRFLDEKGGIPSEPFDPWTLRVRNYVSSCFPVRKEFFPGWNESLKSLQDWDFWLGVLDKGGKGHFLKGYAFATAYPTPESISGKGCTPEVWLERVNAVKKAHNLPHRRVCVASLDHVTEGIRLAKLIDADFQTHPSDKPHDYEVLVQVGLNLASDGCRAVCAVLGDVSAKKRFLFWTADDIMVIYNAISFAAIKEYRSRLNAACTQFVEDSRARELMEDAGFKVQIMPMPLVNTDASAPMPEKPRWLVDISRDYGHVFGAVERALPDISLEVAGANLDLSDCTGVLHFYPDRTMTQGLKRVALAGRHVISNVEQPFMGYVPEGDGEDKLIPALVNKIRKVSYAGNNQKARAYWESKWGPQALLEVLK